MRRVDYLSKEDCCGCGVCVAFCPQDCISMTPDGEGFLYPKIDADSCIACEACYEGCPSVNNSEKKRAPFYNEVYACQIRDENIRHISSSGGAFTALAQQVFQQKGYVAGVAYTSDFKAVEHIITSDPNQLDSLRRSKLLQSNKGDIYRRVENKLAEGHAVLFSGTPCEVAALRSFLSRDYRQLITCDLICGCVASPNVYRKYIEHLEHKYHSKVVSVNFKDKSQGWQARKLSVEFENGQVYTGETADDPYIVAFHSRYAIRPSCFNCKHRGMERSSDFTLGDFWGLTYFDSDLDDNKGTSFVMVNTEKGRDFLHQTTEIMNSKELELDIHAYSTKYNIRIAASPVGADEAKRKQFFDDLDSMNFDELFQCHLYTIWLERKQKKEAYFKSLEKE